MIFTLITALLTSFNVSVSNPTADLRKDVPVVIKLDNVDGNVRSVALSGRDGIPWQLDDMNGDGRNDELVLMLDLKPRETVDLTVSLSDDMSSDKAFESGTNAYIKLNDKNKKYPEIASISYPGNVDNREMYNSIYGHGAVLEGLNSAIRVYMDNRQSVDLYAKNTPRLELSTTGFYTTSDQLNQGYGRDILWAGTSVALGSFRAWNDGNIATIDSVRTRGQRVVTRGPLRSVIEVVDRGWRNGDETIDMTQRYTVYKGHRDYEVEIMLDGSPVNAIYATGVQKVMNDNVGFIESNGLAGSWGNNVPDKNMSQVVDTLGLGISVMKPYLVKTLEDNDNYLTLISPDSDGVIRYTFTSAALRDTESPRTADEWFAWLRQWRRLLENPVRIKVSAGK